MQYMCLEQWHVSQMQRDDDASRCGIRSRRSWWMRWDEDASWCRHLLSRRSDAVKWSGAQVRSRDLQFLSRQARQSHSINLVTLILTAWPSRLLQPLIIIIIIKVFLRLESALIEMFWSFFLPTLALFDLNVLVLKLPKILFRDLFKILHNTTQQNYSGWSLHQSLVVAIISLTSDPHNPPASSSSSSPLPSSLTTQLSDHLFLQMEKIRIQIYTSDHLQTFHHLPTV